MCVCMCVHACHACRELRARLIGHCDGTVRPKKSAHTRATLTIERVGFAGGATDGYPSSDDDSDTFDVNELSKMPNEISLEDESEVRPPHEIHFAPPLPPPTIRSQIGDASQRSCVQWCKGIIEIPFGIPSCKVHEHSANPYGLTRNFEVNAECGYALPRLCG
jgi:hypothetical protein